MSITDDFNKAGYTTRKVNGFVLSVNYDTTGGSSVYLMYDFMARVMITRTGDSGGGSVVRAFSELDAQSLQAMRQRLIDLGGNPPELAAPESQDTLSKPRRLNP